MNPSFFRCLIVLTLFLAGLVFVVSARALVTTVPAQACHAHQINLSDPQSFMPDPLCTPGVIDPNVTQDNLQQTICMKGYTAQVRPSVTYTNSLKKKQILQYGYSDTSPANYEEDHLISLELGGSPANPQNLWPEPHPSVNEKDTVENYLKNQVCARKIPLAQAQYLISHTWYSVYRQLHPASITQILKIFIMKFLVWLKNAIIKE